MLRMVSLAGVLLLSTLGSAAAAVSWNDIGRQPAAWYAGDEARTIATTIRLYQTDSGGWPKNHDMTVPPSPEFLAATAFDHRAPTLDNDATTAQILFLARVASAGDDEPSRAAVLRGLKYLLSAQYKNGGWPQYYPLIPGYYTHITFNDDAMVNVLEVLREVAAGRAPFAWVEEPLRTRAAVAVEKGLACILRCQIEVGGRKTAWCAQHDEITFEPVPARAYEHTSLSGNETVGIVRYLMAIDQPSPAIVAAIQSAVTWLEQVKLTGIRIDRPSAPELAQKHDRIVVADPNAPPIWARFYEIGTNRPIFGGRDTVIRYTLAEIEPERRGGYNWYGDAPRQLLEHDYPLWAKKWGVATGKP